MELIDTYIQYRENLVNSDGNVEGKNMAKNQDYDKKNLKRNIFSRFKLHK